MTPPARTSTATLGRTLHSITPASIMERISLHRSLVYISLFYPDFMMLSLSTQQINNAHTEPSSTSLRLLSLAIPLLLRSSSYVLLFYIFVS